ncbi:PREDICTED: F-box protein At3g07870-like [Populus euphratica]|uniref:F-box protein At3g07870-like n=1 Tax=Populus euphratica TaxID=75702 RepID=A0AAJ6V8J6_POPEU|nr:PREDICTED: F-box protein At3g07870-like [Populus euphratica]
MDHRRKKVTKTETTDLPICLLEEILSRLPMRSPALGQCRLVCKTWLHLISETYFSKLKLESHPRMLVKTIPETYQSREIISVRIAEGVNGRTFQVERSKKLVPKKDLPTSNFELVNSCRGLLCISEGKSRNVIHVCNPVFREHITISVNRPLPFYQNSFCLGLGITNGKDEFKVLRTFCLKTNRRASGYPRAEIYTIGTKKWRRIGNPLSCIEKLDFDTSVHGYIHWIPDQKILQFICSFNFGKEQFGQLPLPPTYDGNDARVKLGVLKDCLCVSVPEKVGSVDKFGIWVMKKYGIKQSWIQQYVIENLYPDVGRLKFYEPLIFLSTGEILISFNGEFLVCYNTTLKKLARKSTITQTKGGIHAIAYNPSLVSLNVVARGEKVRKLPEPEKKKGDEEGKVSTLSSEIGVRFC